MPKFHKYISVDSLSWLYKDHTESVGDHTDNQESSRRWAADVRYEVRFRFSQAEEILIKARNARHFSSRLTDECMLNATSRERLTPTGKTIRMLFQAPLEIGVVAELGGIVNPPRLDEDGNVKIGPVWFNNSHLPQGRGFRRHEYKNFALLDLVKSYPKLIYQKDLAKAEELDTKRAISDFSDASIASPKILELATISLDDREMRLWSERTSLEVIKQTLGVAVDWVDSVVSVWEKLKTRLQMADLLP